MVTQSSYTLGGMTRGMGPCPFTTLGRGVDEGSDQWPFGNDGATTLTPATDLIVTLGTARVTIARRSAAAATPRSARRPAAAVRPRPRRRPAPAATSAGFSWPRAS